MIASTRCSFFWRKIKRRTISFICLADVGQQIFWWPKKTPLALSWKSSSRRSYEGCERFGSVNTHKCNKKWQLVVLCQTSVGWHEALGLLQTVLQLEVVYPLFEAYPSVLSVFHFLCQHLWISMTAKQKEWTQSVLAQTNLFECKSSFILKTKRRKTCLK